MMLGEAVTDEEFEDAQSIAPQFVQSSEVQNQQNLTPAPNDSPAYQRLHFVLLR